MRSMVAAWFELPLEVQSALGVHVKMPEFAVGVEAGQLSQTGKMGCEEGGDAVGDEVLRHRPCDPDAVRRRCGSAELVDEHQALIGCIVQSKSSLLYTSVAAASKTMCISSMDATASAAASGMRFLHKLSSILEAKCSG